MIRTAKVLFCDNEHGTGDITFPEVLDAQRFITEQPDTPANAVELRREAKKSGWGRVNGGDYCPTCMESM
jgi:hypothetical protein